MVHGGPLNGERHVSAERHPIDRRRGAHVLGAVVNPEEVDILGLEIGRRKVCLGSGAHRLSIVLHADSRNGPLGIGNWLPGGPRSEAQTDFIADHFIDCGSGDHIPGLDIDDVESDGQTA